MFIDFILNVVVTGLMAGFCAISAGFMWAMLSDVNNTLSDAVRAILKLVSILIGICSFILAVACLWSLGCFILDFIL